MKIAESRDIKWKRKLNVDTDKLIEKVFILYWEFIFFT